MAIAAGAAVLAVVGRVTYTVLEGRTAPGDSDTVPGSGAQATYVGAPACALETCLALAQEGHDDGVPQYVEREFRR